VRLQRGDRSDGAPAASACGLQRNCSMLVRMKRSRIAELLFRSPR
jgi:hypothetical protein